MKELKEKVKGFLCLPITEATEKKVGEVGKLEATVIQNGLVLMKSQMTAMEVIKTIEGLEDVIDALYFTLASAAGVCGGQGCQTETMDAVGIKLPEFILEDAGISKDAKLCAYTDEGSGEVTVIEAEYKHDITDVSEDTLQILKAMGVCLTGFNECLMAESIIYGKPE
jgi:hypothetical protein